MLHLQLCVIGAAGKVTVCIAGGFVERRHDEKRAKIVGVYEWPSDVRAFGVVANA